MAQLSTPVLVALFAGMGVVILGLLIFIGFLVVRAGKEHKRKLADLEERGIAITRANESKSDAVSRPRAVLRRNTVLPFNAKSGWGTLPSVETIKSAETPSIPPHYAPPRPAGFVAKSSRLSWPFHARRASGKAIHMRKIRVPVLSTVIESPKPSPLVPILSRSSLGGDPPSPRKSGSRPSSDQSLLSRHPAFRNNGEGDATTSQRDTMRRSLTAKHTSKTEPRVRPNRSKSDAEVTATSKDGVLSQFDANQRHARSISMCSQSSGNAPEAPVPPLPLEVARLKSDETRRSLLSRSPSRISVSSFESAGSSILATRSSPILPRSRNIRLHAVSKRDWRNSMITGPRPQRDTAALHGRNQRSQGSIKSSAARFSQTSPEANESLRGKRSSTAANSSTNSFKITTAESVTLSKVSSPASTVRSYTPKRKSGSLVNAYGSPEERFKSSSTLRNTPGNCLQRQLSQASTQASSTRSSNGNPFQWDPAPLSSGKPSALKGSPSARKGHRRQNCVRISLAPTILGPPSRPPSRSPSPSLIHDIQEESPNATSEKRNSVGLGFSSTRSLPRPPSSSTFAPDLKDLNMNTTSIRASLTSGSPTLPLAPYDYGPIGGEKSGIDNKRTSTGTTAASSVFTISAFPSPCRGIPTGNALASPPPTFSLSRPSNEFAEQRPVFEFPYEPSSPFDVVPQEVHSSPERPLLADEYDPEQPSLVYQTPTGSPTRNFSSPFSTIQEESSATATRTADFEQQPDDSPPCSPKTLRAGTASQEFPQYSVQYSSIPEEPLDTIDPAVLSRDAFSTLNSNFRPTTSILKPSTYGRESICLTMPTSTASARDMMQPLLDAAFPSSPPVQHPGDSAYASFEQPGSQSTNSSPTSMYSACFGQPSSPSPSASNDCAAPCSPRPRHAELPTPALNFSDMPTLNPSIGGPRKSPASPLRTSIAKLRRMNSDAEKDGKDKAARGERRYLRLGREDSIALPGEESYLDELEDLTATEDVDDEGSTMDEEKSRRLVGDILDWEEEDTMMPELENHITGGHTVQADTGAGAQVPTSTSNTRASKASADVAVSATNKRLSQLPPLAIASSPPSVKTDANRSSSIWDDGEKFWQSTPPQAMTAPNKAKARNAFMPLSSSPLSTRTNRKRDFEVAKDANNSISPTQVENHWQYPNSNDDNSNSNSSRKRVSNNRYRKRSVLGTVSTPNAVNVRILVQPPSGGSDRGAGMGTPGSLYDNDGFLRA